MALILHITSAVVWTGPTVTLSTPPALRCRMAMEEQQPRDKFSVLERRISSLEAEEAEVQCILLDCMVPKQRFEFQFPPPIGGMLRQVRENGQTLAVLGMSHSFDANGRPVLGSALRNGVEARIESLLSVPMGDSSANPTFFSAHTAPMGVTGGPGGGGERIVCAYDATLIGGRRFELVEVPAALKGGKPPPMSQPIFPAKVRWLPDATSPAPSAAIALAETLPPLVQEWTEHVLLNDLEKERGQVKRIYADLGPMPEVEDAENLALWVAGLVNPLPGLNINPELELRLEFRPAVLAAASPLERVVAARDGIVKALALIKTL